MTPRDWPTVRTAEDCARDRLAAERAQGLVSVGLFDARRYVDAEPVGLFAEHGDEPVLSTADLENYDELEDVDLDQFEWDNGAAYG